MEIYLNLLECMLPLHNAVVSRHNVAEFEVKRVRRREEEAGEDE